ncbi:MAG: hypothetical protein HON90_07345, partial [Halobacteriovoraceae bacterium]|nr:hypothetical protein [Halobacteriovoraceae bacterium]
MGLILLLIGLSVSIYRPDFKDVHSYSVFAESPNISYTLTNKDTDNNELDKLIYEPNVHSFTGIAVSNDYGTLSLSAQNIDQEKSHIDSSTLF